MIEHIGTIDKIENGTVVVRITQQPSCFSCRARKICASSGQKEKLIEIECGPCSGLLYAGETVMVTGTTSMAFISVFFAFILPSLLILAALFVANANFLSEGIAALATIGFLALYYIILYFFRNLLKRNLKFTLVKLETKAP